jgi:5-formyltetrahydrofolate cyclo-ligase
VPATPEQRKVELRAAARAARRQALEGAQTLVGAGAAEALRAVVMDVPEVASAHCVAAYVDRGGEPPTGALLSALSAAGIGVLLPVLQEDLDLDWALDDGPRTASSVRAGLLEPAGERLGPQGVESADVLVVPALAVDRGGVRLGYGGGSYDRALARARPSALRLALLYDGELLDAALPELAHDERVDGVVMPGRGLVRLPGRR